MISELYAGMYSGVSGLKANSSSMTVIGDNVANVNTTGFKSNRSQFANILSTSLGGQSSTGNVGRGVELWGVNSKWTQGSIENSSNAMDLAINGKGLFIIQDDSGSNFYSRAGNFQFDNNGYLVNPDGMRLQGYHLDASGKVGVVESVCIPGERISAPSATSELSFDLNLSAAAAVGESYTTTQTVYDSLGNAVPLMFTFTKTGDGEWSVAGSIPTAAGSGVAMTSSGTAFSRITFDAAGRMLTPVADVDVVLTLTNGSSNLSMNWNIFNDTTLAFSNGNITEFATDSITTFQNQNGYPAGKLGSITVDDQGIITATYSNGAKTPMFQVALADFANYDGLTKMGRNLYAESMSSGQALASIAGTGLLGSISPSSLEMSNVDLAEEFVKMITAQHAFQANARLITSGDEILQELVNIKR